jgi:tetratricopeptide (TPR) repeat protein
LDVTLQELGRLEEAEASYRQAIALKPDFAEVHRSLGIVLHANGDVNPTIESREKAYEIDPNPRVDKLLLKALRSRKIKNNNKY